jgi:hypothetical protein
MLVRKKIIRVKATGAYALNQLGLSKQVPTSRIYITDFPNRLFSFEYLSANFKKSTPKKLEKKGTISSLVIQAIEDLGLVHTGSASLRMSKISEIE